MDHAFRNPGIDPRVGDVIKIKLWNGRYDDAVIIGISNGEVEYRTTNSHIWCSLADWKEIFEYTVVFLSGQTKVNNTSNQSFGAGFENQMHIVKEPAPNARGWYIHDGWCNYLCRDGEWHTAPVNADYFFSSYYEAFKIIEQVSERKCS
jgi:hypothetical protein